MRKRVKKAIKVAICIVIIIIAIISTFFIVRYYKDKEKIENVIEIYSNDKVEDRLDTKESDSKDELLLQIDGESVVGIVKIEKIGFEGLVYNGTSLDTLDKGVGHFDNSPYLEGNVCLAAHNSNKFWAKLYTLQNGDKITYISFLGTKEYEVNNVSQISETDWSKLENSDTNMVTLITCVKGKPALRLCVQGIEVD